MDAVAALARLSSLVAAADVPTLSDEDLDDLLDAARRPDCLGVSPRCTSAAPEWTATTAIGVRSIIRQGTDPDRWWIAETTGVTGATEPEWPALTGLMCVGTSRLLDGDVIWRDAGPEWSPTWDLPAAAAEGWRRKAGKVAADVTVQTGDQTLRSEQLIANCLRMAAVYAGTGPGSGRSGGGGSLTIGRG